MKFALIICSMLIAGIDIQACDVCGSGSGGAYMGLLPRFSHQFVGMRFQQNALTSHLGQGNSSSYLTTTDRYRTLEIWGARNLGKRFRITSYIPFHFIDRTANSHTTHKRGFGDITLVGYYQLLDQRKKTGKRRSPTQSLWIGAGIKLPTGSYDPDEHSIQESAQNTFQLGTASTDFSFHMLYDLQVHNIGFTTNLGYQFNTFNRYNYRYGNKATLNLLGYYRLRIGDRLMLLPNAGWLFELSSKDQHTRQLTVWQTGGHACQQVMGTEISFGCVNIGTNIQLPLFQRLGEESIRGKARAMLHMSFSW